MAHLNYYLDLCVEAFIVNDGAVLLRLHEKYNIWTGPGGHIEPGEDANEAILREAKEETGLAIELVGPAGWEKQDTETNKDLVPPIYVNRHHINEQHDHSAFIFVAQSKNRELQPEEAEDANVKFVWVNEAELEKMHENDPRLRPEVYKYAKTALSLANR